MSCPAVNDSVDENCFFCPDGIHWDAHRIGWAVAGGCAALTTLVTLFTTTMHATHYQNPAVQKQVLRVLMMPCVYAIVSFLSYRYYQQYYYFSIGETAYESITLSAFLMLLMELVAMTNPQGMIQATLANKDKRKFPFPFNCWRFRASKPYFWHALSFSVMQYVVIRPLLSIVAIICEYYNLLCPQKYSPYYAEAYLDVVDCISISIALYGLIVFYVICKDELKGRRPLNKFLAIKLIVIFTFYQGFVFDVLQDYNVIKSSELWTATNVSNGLQALCTCVEMVFFSIYMGWAYSWTDYTNPELNPTRRETGWKTYFQAIWDAINVSDFATELVMSTKFFIAFLQGKPGTRGSHTKMQKTFMPETIDGGEKPYPMGSMYNPDPNVVGNKEQQPPISPTYQYHYNRSSPAATPGGTTYPHPSMDRSPDSYQRIDDSAYAYQHQHQQYQEHRRSLSLSQQHRQIPYTTNYGAETGDVGVAFSPDRGSAEISPQQWNDAIRRTEWPEARPSPSNYNYYSQGGRQ